jgi:ABC-type glutathione transport system ATPase component
MMGARFRLRLVSKAYRDFRRKNTASWRGGAAASWRGGTAASLKALTAVDFDILDGQVNALLGRSGAGKSTLARIVMGFTAPDSGEVLYRDRPVCEAPLAAFRRCNQMVFQNPFLAVNPLFTVGEIIGEPLRTLTSVSPRTDPVPDEGSTAVPGSGEKISAILERLELPGACVRRLPHELSGGELQRVVLARALIMEPEFLVLDEPFSALDDLGAMRILRQCQALIRRLGLGVLFISHHPRHVSALADRVVVLEKGRIVAGGG